MSPPSVILTLVAPRLLEEKLVQTLIDHEVAGAAGFSIREIIAYGRALDFRTLAEQISGRVRQIEVRMVLSVDHAQQIVEQLKAEMPGQHVAWQIAPIAAGGDLSRT
ncbi:MAG: DUF3240 family protein [Rhizobiales bacterium]|nr:DUF3240 family protein [Hyphomicrobiales bacterium]